jgi:hypothetical protein
MIDALNRSSCNIHPNGSRSLLGGIETPYGATISQT